MTKLVILSLFMSLAVISNCGVIDTVYGKVKNTTIVIKDDIKSWWNYGKDLVFGNDEDAKRLKEAENAIHVTKDELEKDKGSLSEAYQKAKDGVLAIRKRIHDIIMGEETNDSKRGFLQNVYDRVSKRVGETKVYFIGNDELDTNGSAQKAHQNFGEDTKAIREGINKFVSRRTLNNRSISNGFDSTINKLEDTKSNVEIGLKESVDKGESNAENVGRDIGNEINTARETFTTTGDNIEQGVRDAVSKERELMNTANNNVNGLDTLKNNVLK